MRLNILSSGLLNPYGSSRVKYHTNGFKIRCSNEHVADQFCRNKSNIAYRVIVDLEKGKGIQGWLLGGVSWACASPCLRQIQKSSFDNIYFLPYRNAFFCSITSILKLILSHKKYYPTSHNPMVGSLIPKIRCISYWCLLQSEKANAELPVQ